MRSLLALFVVLAPSVASAHGVSKSYADWTLDGNRAALRISFAAHDVLAAVQGLDANGDKALAAAELEEKRSELGARVVKHTTVRAGRDAATDECTADDTPVVRGVGDPVEELQVSVTFTCPEKIGVMSLRARYLPELEPPHATLATVSAASKAAQHVFTPETPTFDVQLELPALSDELTNALLAGLKVNLTWGPMLFCLGLLLSRRGRGVMPVLAAFVIAHGVIICFGGPRLPFIPLVAALGVAWIGLETFVSSIETKPGHQYVAFAAIFGIVFGVLAGARAPYEPLLKVAFAVGATGPILLSFLGGRVLLSMVGEYLGRTLRGVGAALIGAGAVLVVLHFVA